MKNKILHILYNLSTGKIKYNLASKQVLDLFDDSCLSEAKYLLYTKQPDKCANWKEGVSDCHKSECEFCRIQKCIDKLENIL